MVFQSPDACTTCQVCGGYRLLPCPMCNGSKKSVHRNHFTTEMIALKCMNCDEVGLVQCYACWTANNTLQFNNIINYAILLLFLLLYYIVLYARMCCIRRLCCYSCFAKYSAYYLLLFVGIINFCRKLLINISRQFVYNTHRVYLGYFFYVIITRKNTWGARMIL